jgi:hypothetical protein
MPNAALPFADTQLISPPELLAALPDDAFERPPVTDREPGQGPLPRDLFYRRMASLAEGYIDARVRIIRYEGIDVAGHHFLRFTMPDAFGDVSPAERQRYGQVLEQQYGLIDTEIGRMMDTLGPNDLLVVVSGFGMDPQSPGKRLLALVLGEPQLAGTHERAPDGFLLVWGERAAAGRLPLGSLVDVAPTLLYFLGLPVARDMDGTARTDIFTPAFTAQNPVTYIPSYER